MALTELCFSQSWLGQAQQEQREVLKAELVSPARCSVSMAYRAKASYEQHLKPGVTTETELKRTTLTEILPKNFNAKKYSPLHKTPHRPSA